MTNHWPVDSCGTTCLSATGVYGQRFCVQQNGKV